MDRKEISGEIVYDYPLSLAYADGIFGEIQYVPVQDGENKDIDIARKAEEVLLSDRDAGLNHSNKEIQFKNRRQNKGNSQKAQTE